MYTGVIHGFGCCAYGKRTLPKRIEHDQFLSYGTTGKFPAQCGFAFKYAFDVEGHCASERTATI